MSTTATAPDIAVRTPSDRELEYTYTFDGPRELLFDVFTRPEHLPHWMLGPEGWTMPVCETDLRPGGAWHYVWRRGDGSEMEMNGVYQDVSRPGRVVNTEAWGGDWPETLNTLEFHEHGGRTTVVSRMLFPDREARDRAAGIGMLDGVRASYARLEDYLRTIA
ncbi:MAG TPA: SRPBCC family protein [Longimicrobium sp.]|nr:SRPBCC family protein [Longimicrobium sp.]